MLDERQVEQITKQYRKCMRTANRAIQDRGRAREEERDTDFYDTQLMKMYYEMRGMDKVLAIIGHKCERDIWTGKCEIL